MRGQKFHFSGNLDSLLGHSLVNIPISEKKKTSSSLGVGREELRNYLENILE